MDSLRLLVQLKLALSLVGTLAAYYCNYKYLPDSALTLLNSLSLGRKGLLASLYNIQSADECVKNCVYFDSCYLAEYQQRGGIGFCELYYYHYPAIYEFEANSPVRVVNETKWPESKILFNITCERNADRPRCDFYSQQKRKSRHQDASSVASSQEEAPELKPSLTVEQCALMCGSSESCNGAVFIPPDVLHDVRTIFGKCLLHRGTMAAVKSANKFADQGAMLIGEIQCENQKAPCTFRRSAMTYGSENDLDVPADVYYAVQSDTECAQICGRVPDCLEAEFVNPPNERPNCLLYRSGTIAQAAKTLGMHKKDYKRRLTEIYCSGDFVPPKAVRQPSSASAEALLHASSAGSSSDSGSIEQELSTTAEPTPAPAKTFGGASSGSVEMPKYTGRHNSGSGSVESHSGSGEEEFANSKKTKSSSSSPFPPKLHTQGETLAQMKQGGEEIQTGETLRVSNARLGSTETNSDFS